jgi:hypothetical protein
MARHFYRGDSATLFQLGIPLKRVFCSSPLTRSQKHREPDGRRRRTYAVHFGPFHLDFPSDFQSVF